jgi:BlaI family penicillinase repressor
MAELNQLSKRERQIMDVIYARGEATASDVVSRMPDPPTRDAVRTFLRFLEQKGHLTHRKQGREFVYSPVQTRNRMGQSALRRVFNVFFDGSVEKALAAHLAGPRRDRPSPEELERLLDLIRQAKGKGL